jgi:hypothetical protein
MMVLAGVILALVGMAVWGLGRIGFRGLPGDVRYESDNVRVYFPIVTCLVLLAAATLGVWLWRWVTGK